MSYISYMRANGTLEDSKNIADTSQMNLVDNWRNEIIERVSKHHNPQKRQSNYERNIRVYESVQMEVSKTQKKSYYKSFIDNVWIKRILKK